jgi:predicted RNase H-like nuclease (RuvC/YqgF family)
MSEEAKMTPDQQAKAEKEFRKRQAMDLADYKKRLREGNDLKKLQVEELELNIRYYHAKREWFDLREKLEQLDNEEQEVLAQEAAKRKQEVENLRKEAAKKKKEVAKKIPAPEQEKPKIIIPEQGQPRAK